MKPPKWKVKAWGGANMQDEYESEHRKYAGALNVAASLIRVSGWRKVLIVRYDMRGLSRRVFNWNVEDGR